MQSLPKILQLKSFDASTHTHIYAHYMCAHKKRAIFDPNVNTANSLNDVTFFIQGQNQQLLVLLMIISFFQKQLIHLNISIAIGRMKISTLKNVCMKLSLLPLTYTKA